MSILDFIGSGFSIESVSYEALATVRLRFTNDPKLVNPSLANDGLHLANYSISGPAPMSLVGVTAVAGDPQAVDLFLAGVLNPGEWIISVSASLISVDAEAITTPMSMSLFVDAVPAPESVNPGAVQGGAASILRQNLNPALIGDGWDALIAAFAVGDDWIEETAELAFDQLFKISATGQYLTRHAADDGLQKPTGIGMPDDLFRFYAIKHATGQLTENSILDILSVFYGDDSLRAFADSINGPFTVTSGMDLSILVDESLAITVTFTADDFAIPGQATAQEVGAAITRAFTVQGSNAYSIGVTDPETGLQRVRIYSAALGLGSSIRITGGQAQNIFQFPTLLPIYDLSGPVPTWNIVVDPVHNTTRFNLTNSELNPDLSQILIGDYVNVYGTEFVQGNRGSFPIIDVSYMYSGSTPVAYFEVAGQLQNQTVAETAMGLGMIFYRPNRQTIHGSGSRAVIVAVPGPVIDVQLPATSQAVGRTEFIAAYGQVQTAIPLASIMKASGTITATTTAPHGLSVGSQVIIDSVIADISVPPVFTGVYTNHALNRADSSIASIFSKTGGTWYASLSENMGIQGGIAVAMPSGDIFHGLGRRGSQNFSVLHMVSNAVTAGRTVTTYREVASATGPMPVPREYMGATLGTNPAWFDGNVIMTGGTISVGTASAGTPYNTVYQAILNDVSGAFVINLLAPTLLEARGGHNQLTLVAPGNAMDGGFFVAGGVGVAPNTALNTCERWAAPDGSTWVTRSSMAIPRAQAEVVTLADGRVMVIGGRALAQGHKIEASTVARYSLGDVGTTVTDTGPNSLDLTDTGTVTRVGAEVGYGRSYVVGAKSSRAVNDTVLDDLFASKSYTIQGFISGNAPDVFGSAVITYSTTTPGDNLFLEMEVSRDGSSNFTVDLQFCYGAQVYENITLTGTAPVATFNHYSLTVASDGTIKLYLDGILADTQSIDPAHLGGGTLGSNKLCIGHGPSFYGNAIGVSDDVRISAGARTAEEILDDFKTAVGEWQYDDISRVGRILASCEIYDPVANTWTATGSMAISRFTHKAFALADGRVIVIGGLGYNPTQPSDDPLPLTTAEVWNPVTNSWSFAGRTKYSRAFAMAEYDTSREQIVVFGGTDTEGSKVIELFDTRKFKWSISPARINLNTVTGIAGAASAINKYGMIFDFGGYDIATGNPMNVDGLVTETMNVYVPGADQFMGTGFNGFHTVDSVIGTTGFTTTAVDNQYGVGIGGTATPVAALPSEVAGPFVWEPDSGVAVTKTSAVLAEDLAANHHYGFITVDDASQFPDQEGFLVLAFGYENQVAPIKYYNRVSDTQLSIDYGLLFPKTVLAGATVTLLHNKGSYNPATPEQDGSFYITDSPAGRIVAEQAVNAAAGAGIEVNIEVVYPGDRGLAGEGLPTHGAYKLSDVVGIFGGSDPDAETVKAREDD